MCGYVLNVCVWKNAGDEAVPSIGVLVLVAVVGFCSWQRSLAGEIDCVDSVKQLRNAGVFEAVYIRKQGYPFRDNHEHFYRR